MSIFDQAQELGKEIAQTQEYTRMESAEKAVRENPQAAEAVREYQNLQNTYYRMQMSGQELTEANMKELKEAEDSAMSNSLVKDYYETRMEFHKMVEQVNAKIQEGITGRHSHGGG